MAVVKSSVFAIIRLTYCCFGTELLSGSFAHYAALITVIFTILFGAVKAVRETHWKRRLAYSTVANLSYILFGALLLTEDGLHAGLLHMAFHAEIKILAFFAAGAVLRRSGKEYIPEMDGMAKRMPVTFSCFLVAALALTGIPPFSGFISKWALLSAAAASGTWYAYAGAGTILLAALLTAVYCFSVLRRAFFPDRAADLTGLSGIREAGPRMLIPMCFLAAAILLTGLFAGAISDAVSKIAASAGSFL